MADDQAAAGLEQFLAGRADRLLRTAVRAAGAVRGPCAGYGRAGPCTAADRHSMV